MLVLLRTDDERVQLRRLRMIDPAGRRRKAREAGTPIPVCSAPCGVEVDGNDWFSVGGEGLVPSEPFQLPEDASEVRLRVTLGNEAEGTVGAVLIRLGAPLLAVSVILVAAFSNDHPVLYGAAGVAGLAVLTLLVGIPLYAANRTEVTTENGVRLGALRLTPTGIVF